MKRLEQLYVFTLLWHFRGLMFNNWSEPVWTSLWYFLSKSHETVWTGLNRFTFLRCCGISFTKVLESVWTGLNRFMVFFEQLPENGVNRFEPVYVFKLLWHFRLLKSLSRSEPVWTGLRFRVFFLFFENIAMNRCETVRTALRFYVVVTFLWTKV